MGWEACGDVTRMERRVRTVRTGQDVGMSEHKVRDTDEKCVDFDGKPTQSAAEEAVRRAAVSSYGTSATVGKVIVSEKRSALASIGNFFANAFRLQAESLAACQRMSPRAFDCKVMP